MAPVENETMSRLRGRKAEVSDHIEQRRAATRFEPTPGAPVDDAAVEDAASGAENRQTPTTEDLGPEAEKDDDTYTSRLLKAKKKVWEDRDKQ